MGRLCLQYLIWVLLFIIQMLETAVSGSSWCPYPPNQPPEFEQKTDRFWVFQEKSNSWTEIDLPFDLLTCLDGNCTKVGLIQQREKKESQKGSTVPNPDQDENCRYDDKPVVEESIDQVLPLRRRISLIKMSDTSVWVTGESGSIYERFWNGVQWVIAPHDLPISAGYAVSIFVINQTILALSEAGNLYQLQMSENSMPVWTEFTPAFESSMHITNGESGSPVQIKNGVFSQDERLYFFTTSGSLLELSELQPLRWTNHGRPPGGNVAAIADAKSIRSDIVFTISSTGDLYEFDKSSKPSWKKHIWSELPMEDLSLSPSTGCSLHGLIGAHSLSVFLLSKSGFLVERRLHRRKWKWVVHGAPKGHYLSAITPIVMNDMNTKIYSLFLTTTTGFVFEYRLPKNSGGTQGNRMSETWVNHMHPPHAKVAKGISGLQLQVGRMLFPLDDGRVGELHLSGIGGEGSGPTQQPNVRRKAPSKYEWSILDAPETEGWNAEYCTDERGPSNCIAGTKIIHGNEEPNDSGVVRETRRRKVQVYQDSLSPSTNGNSPTETLHQNSFITNRVRTNFRMRAMQADRSLFLITDGGLIFEYLYTDNVWLWLRHDHSTTMRGVLGSYNGSLFLVDVNGSLLIRERGNNGLEWINCTAMRRGKQVILGPPWDGIPGKAQKVTVDDALFFVSKKGRLLQFTVALRKFKWKDCRNPQNVKVASIVDQEGLRSNIVYVTGNNGRLYQYNKVTELWHEHYQSPHLMLSRLPGTVMRPSLLSLTGSLFMLSEDGGLIEYHWNANDGWNWVEHGTPQKNVTLSVAPGPCFEGNQLFVIGSDGYVYNRYMDERTWKWKSYGFPSMENIDPGAQIKARRSRDDEAVSKEIIQDCIKVDGIPNFDTNAHMNFASSNCNEKVAPVRPIPFSGDSIVFELRDGRLGELRKTDDTDWGWSRIISTPTSQCIASYWTASAA